MADVTDGQHVADDAVAVAVDGVDVGGDIVQDHLALELGALVGVEAHIVGVLVEAQGGHVQLAGGAVGGLAVEPDQGLILVVHLDVAAAGGLVRGGAGVGAAGGLLGLVTAAAGGQAKYHCKRKDQCKSLFHSDSPFS